MGHDQPPDYLFTPGNRPFTPVIPNRITLRMVPAERSAGGALCGAHRSHCASHRWCSDRSAPTKRSRHMRGSRRLGVRSPPGIPGRWVPENLRGSMVGAKKVARAEAMEAARWAHASPRHWPHPPQAAHASRLASRAAPRRGRCRARIDLVRTLVGHLGRDSELARAPGLLGRSGDAEGDLLGARLQLLLGHSRKPSDSFAAAPAQVDEDSR